MSDSEKSFILLEDRNIKRDKSDGKTKCCRIMKKETQAQEQHTVFNIKITVLTSYESALEGKPKVWRLSQSENSAYGFCLKTADNPMIPDEFPIKLKGNGCTVINPWFSKFDMSHLLTLLNLCLCHKVYEVIAVICNCGVGLDFCLLENKMESNVEYRQAQQSSKCKLHYANNSNRGKADTDKMLPRHVEVYSTDSVESQVEQHKIQFERLMEEWKRPIEFESLKYATKFLNTREFYVVQKEEPKSRSTWFGRKLLQLLLNDEHNAYIVKQRN